MKMSYKYSLLLLAILSLSVKSYSRQNQGNMVDTAKINRLNQKSYKYWTTDPEKSKVFAFEAFNLSDSINYQKGLAFANRSLGVANWAQGNYEEGLSYLIKAREKYRSLNDQVNVANVNLNTGLIYNAQGNYKKALTLYHQAINTFNNYSKTKRSVNTLNHIGESHQLMGEIDSANFYYKQALNTSLIVDYEYGKATAMMYLGSLFKNLHQPDSALVYCQRALDIQNKIEDNYGKTSTLLYLGQVYKMKDRLQLSKKYLLEGLKLAQHIRAKKLKSDILYELVGVYKAQGDFQKSLVSFEEYKTLSDSLLNAELIRNISRLENKVQLERNANQLVLLKKEARIDTILRYILIAAILSAIAFGYLIYSRQRLKNIKSKELLLSQRELSRFEMENAQLKERELQQKIDYKNKELTSYALNFQQKNELIEEIKDVLDELKKLKIVKVSSKLSGLSRLVKTHGHIDKEWHDFKKYFEEVHNDFFTSLKNQYPDLSNNELKLCALLKLNLNMKESANILGISPDSVKTARYRLRKKLKLTTEQNLVDFIINFEKEIN